MESSYANVPWTELGSTVTTSDEDGPHAASADATARTSPRNREHEVVFTPTDADAGELSQKNARAR